jgi:peptidoglycan/LPS O-acetylase OafA/YrhL
MSMEISGKSRNIPSLDGMRAISILLVIVGHTNDHFRQWIKLPPRAYLLFAHTGVLVFFVISGFLITSLLLKELQATRSIHLLRFYLRRAFRIFPPFYFYLGIVLLLTFWGILQTPLSAFLSAATYTLDYYFGPGGGNVSLQHIWSLSVEEQFYLVWPAVLLFFGRRNSVRVAIGLIVISPATRVLTYYFLAPEHRAMVGRMFHSSVDTIMFGCLLALIWESERFHRWLRVWGGSLPLAVAVLFLCLLDPWLDLRFGGSYSLTVGMTLEGVSICLIIAFVIRRSETLPGRVLNTRVMRHIGIISYSLYLWQSMLLGAADRYFPFNLLAVLACAEISYWAVERPALRLRDQVQLSFTAAQSRG